MEDHAQAWAAQMSTGALPKQLNCLSIKTQFWPQVGYGITCSMASFKEITASLWKPYFKILPLCRINCNIQAEFHQLPLVFFGLGLPHPGIEATIESIQVLLQHFRCPTLLGTQLQTSYKTFALKVELSSNPLQESYGKYSNLCTTSWIKALWEQC